MRTYTVRTGRQGKWWWIEIPEVDMGFSQARTFREVATMAREVVALLLDIPADSFAVQVQVEGEEAELIKAVEASSAQAEAAQRAATLEKRTAVSKLKAKNMSVRDIAELLHISPAYVQELSRDRAA